MKKFFTLIALLSLSLVSCKQTAENSTAASTDSTATANNETGSFGDKIDESGVIPMDSLLAMVSTGKSEIANVKVEGKITECCEKKGCWMSIDRGDGTAMRVTFKDYGFFVPLTSGGKTAVMQGRAYMDTTSVEDLRHFAEDGGKSKEDIAKITEPKLELAFEADGVIIK
ncbi:hypothetical protein BH11BAC2_BH11BAC2_12470 [soil metagenome]